VPNRDAQKGEPENPPQARAAQQVAEILSRKTGGGVVGDSGKQDAENNRHRSLKPGGEHER
jgi:hypothetical protein